MPVRDAGTSKYIDGSNNSEVLPYCRRLGLSYVPAARRAVRAGASRLYRQCRPDEGCYGGVRIEFLRKYRKLAVTRLAGRG